MLSLVPRPLHTSWGMRLILRAYMYAPTHWRVWYVVGTHRVSRLKPLPAGEVWPPTGEVWPPTGHEEWANRP